MLNTQFHTREKMFCGCLYVDDGFFNVQFVQQKIQHIKLKCTIQTFLMHFFQFVVYFTDQLNIKLYVNLC